MPPAWARSHNWATSEPREADSPTCTSGRSAWPRNPGAAIRATDGAGSSTPAMRGRRAHWLSRHAGTTVAVAEGSPRPRAMLLELAGARPCRWSSARIVMHRELLTSNAPSVVSNSSTAKCRPQSSVGQLQRYNCCAAVARRRQSAGAGAITSTRRHAAPSGPPATPHPGRRRTPLTCRHARRRSNVPRPAPPRQVSQAFPRAKSRASATSRATERPRDTPALP